MVQELKLRLTNLNLETMLSFSLRPITASWLGKSLRPRYICTEFVLSRQSVQFVLHRNMFSKNLEKLRWQCMVLGLVLYTGVLINLK